MFLNDKGIVKGFMTIGPCGMLIKKTSFELWGLYVEPFYDKKRCRQSPDSVLWKTKPKNWIKEIIVLLGIGR
jgi:hypothetical protein